MKRVASMFMLLLGMLNVLTLSSWGKNQPSTDLKTDSVNSVFTTTVDWYKPPPKRLDHGREVELPYKLFSAVPTLRIDEATLLLGKADIIPLTAEQVARFSSGTDPTRILRTNIQEAEEKLRFYQDGQKRPDNPELIKLLGKHEMGEWKKRNLRYMDELKREIAQLKQWEHQLKPYLAKGVVLKAGGSLSGRLILEDLVIAFGAMGSHAVPMERRPVVAFLPKKPRRVYTTVWMMQ